MEKLDGDQVLIRVTRSGVTVVGAVLADTTIAGVFYGQALKLSTNVHLGACIRRQKSALNTRDKGCVSQIARA